MNIPGAIHVQKYDLINAPTLASFHASTAFVRGIMGPFGSGKSTACCMEILIKAHAQKRAPDGKRYSRWAVVRNSYPELKTTTLKTWGDWCPPQYGKLTMSSPIRHHVQTKEIDMEVLFLALDREEDVKKLLSLELTGAFLNETREIRKSILDAMTGRVGRYPSAGREGCSWSGIFMDTNPPDDQSWWYHLAEEETPEGFQFFKQPSGLEIPKFKDIETADGVVTMQISGAENLPNLPKNYYQRISSGKDPDWIKVFVHGNYGYVLEGKPVFPEYRDAVHTSPDVIEPVPDVPLLLGIDFGLTPAMIIAQKLVDGRWLILDELCAEDTGVKRFAEMASQYISINFPDNVIGGGWGDPAGVARGYQDDTAFDLLNEYFSLERYNTKWRPAPTNDWLMRKEAVRHTLNRMIDGVPGFQLSPKCKMVRKGFAGGYHYKYFKSGNTDQVQEMPNKNIFSHPMDGLQYLILGGGEHNVVLRKNNKRRSNKVVIANDLDYPMFKRNRR